MKISIIQPTITGREDILARMEQAYRDLTPYPIEILHPKDYPCWPAACNAAQREATGDVLHFGSDDLEPLAGWAEPMLACLAAGYLPAPQIWDFAWSDSPPVNQNADGPPGTITAFTRVPSLTRAMAEAIGPWPTWDYYSDNACSDAARLLGWETRVTEAYAFVHHWSQIGRLDKGDWKSRSLPQYNAWRRERGLPPV